MGCMNTSSCAVATYLYIPKPELQVCSGQRIDQRLIIHEIIQFHTDQKRYDYYLPSPPNILSNNSGVPEHT